jgi:hypothetical protein
MKLSGMLRLDREFSLCYNQIRTLQPNIHYNTTLTLNNYMRVKELKKLLENIDNERIVIMSTDCEGNSYSPLDTIDDSSTYLAETELWGELGIEKLTPELRKLGYSEDEIGGEKALVLYPVN